MEVFQFFIGKNQKEDLALDCFFCEPKNIYEKRLGSLFVLGSVEAPFPKNLQILNETARFLREKFYRKSAKKPEMALAETLSEFNSFFEEKIGKELTFWPGRFSFLVLNFRGSKLNFSKTGKMKIQLARGGKIYELGKKGREEFFWPKKFFGKVATGRLLKEDLIFAGNEEIFEFLEKEKDFESLIKEEFDEQKLKKIFEREREKLKNIRGIFFVAFLSKSEKRERIETKEVSLKREIELIFKQLKKTKNKLKDEFKILLSNKKWRLILAFTSILLLGFLIFNLDKIF